MDTEWLKPEGDEETDRPDRGGGPGAEHDDEDLPASDPETAWDEDDEERERGPNRGGRGGGAEPTADMPATLHGDDDGEQPH